MAIIVATGMGIGSLKGVAAAAGQDPNRNKAQVPLLRQCGYHRLFLSSAAGRPPAFYACGEVYHLYRIFAAGFQFGSKRGTDHAQKKIPLIEGSTSALEKAAL